MNPSIAFTDFILSADFVKKYNRQSLNSGKPVIGVCLDWRTAKDEHGQEIEGEYWYSEEFGTNFIGAIQRAGGAPYILEFKERTEDYSHLVSGILIPGGRDLNPESYGQKNEGSDFNETEAEQRFEHLREMMENLNPLIPIFGICYGLQFINVYFGGDLVQNLEHSHLHLHKITNHKVIRAGHTEDALKGHQSQAVCLHHQGIGKVGTNLKVTLVDNQHGYIHGLEYAGTDRNIFSVLFHPELDSEKCVEYSGSRVNINGNNSLFLRLVSLADTYRKTKQHGVKYVIFNN